MSDKRIKKVIALGYFDSVHIGHRAVLEAGKNVASELGASLKVFTFSGNLKKALSKGDETVVYTIDERKDLFSSIGVDEVFYAPTDNEFLSLDRSDFLDFLNANDDVVCYVCGEDYRFGLKGLGDVEFLEKYASEHGQTVRVQPTKTVNGNKVSTTLIKELLTAGLIESANNLLGESYFIKGVVEQGRKVGSELGFPTANIFAREDKTKLKHGVYYGHTVIDGVYYKAVINYGAKPTFKVFAESVEAHLIDFDGCLYGKQITLYFDGFLREIIKFTNRNGLIEQLQKDVKEVKDKSYD